MESLSLQPVGWKWAKWATNTVILPMGIHPVWVAKDVLVKLEIRGKTNESCAWLPSFRCSEAKVVAIYHEGKEVTPNQNTVFSWHDVSFFYNIGSVIYPKKRFDDDLEQIHASGIHYFATRADCLRLDVEGWVGEA